MRTFLAALLALLTFGHTPARAQAIQGYWTGVLEVSPSHGLPIIVEITLGPQGAFSGTLDSPDQNAFGIPLADIAGNGGRLTFAVPAVNLRYEGRWNARRESWDGTVFQAGQALPLVLVAGNPEDRPAPVPLPAQWAIPQEPAIAQIMQDRLADRSVAGMVIGIVEGDASRILVQNPAYGPAFTGDTLFEIGSITKVFTALLLADMVLAGEVALDDPVAQYLPQGAAMPMRGDQPITLRMLAMHTSGLPRLADNMPFGDPANPYADYTEALLLEFLANYQLPRDPGAQFEYSNLGVGLLGYVLGRAGYGDYESLLRDRILSPLGLRRTGSSLTSAGHEQMARGHDDFLRPASEWNFQAMAGAGALRSSGHEMLRLIRAALDPRSPIGPAMALLQSERVGEAGQGQLAPGWSILPTPGGELLHHGGGTGGFRAHLAVQPSRQRGVIVLTNSAVEPSSEDVALHLLAGIPLAIAGPVPPPAAAQPVMTELTLSSQQLERVTGTYQMAPGIELVIRRSEAPERHALTAQLTGQPAFPIFAAGPLEFFWRVVGARITFVAAGEAISGAVLHQNGRDIPLQRVD